MPLYAQRLQGEDGEAEAKKFSEEVLAVFLPTLVIFTLVFQLIMPAFVAAISGYSGEKLELATYLTRITFPYLILISLVSLWAGILNSLAKFTAAAFAPALLNVSMMLALIFFPQGGAYTAFWLAVAVTLGGVIQLGLLIFSAVRAGAEKARMTWPEQLCARSIVTPICTLKPLAPEPFSRAITSPLARLRTTRWQDCPMSRASACITGTAALVRCRAGVAR